MRFYGENRPGRRANEVPRLHRRPWNSRRQTPAVLRANAAARIGYSAAGTLYGRGVTAPIRWMGCIIGVGRRGEGGARAGRCAMHGLSSSLALACVVSLKRPKEVQTSRVPVKSTHSYVSAPYLNIGDTVPKGLLGLRRNFRLRNSAARVKKRDWLTSRARVRCDIRNKPSHIFISTKPSRER